MNDLADTCELIGLLKDVLVLSCGSVNKNSSVFKKCYELT